MNVFEGEIQIRKIRRRGGIGGVIFSAVAVGSNQRFVVKANYQTAPLAYLERCTSGM